MVRNLALAGVAITLVAAAMWAQSSPEDATADLPAERPSVSVDPQPPPAVVGPPQFAVTQTTGCDRTLFEPVIPQFTACYTDRHDAVHWAWSERGRRYSVAIRFHVGPAATLTQIGISSTAVDDDAPYDCIRGVINAIVVGPDQCLAADDEKLVEFANLRSGEEHQVGGDSTQPRVWH